jgi:hypothetical protein
MDLVKSSGTTNQLVSFLGAKRSTQWVCLYDVAHVEAFLRVCWTWYGEWQLCWAIFGCSPVVGHSRVCFFSLSERTGLVLCLSLFCRDWPQCSSRWLESCAW